MARKKKAARPVDSTVSPVDPTTGLLKPRVEMTPEEVTAAQKIDPTVPPKSKLKLERGEKAYRAPKQKRTKPKTKPIIAVTGETLRPATNPELKRGIPSRVVRDQSKPTTPAAGPRLPRIGQIYKHSDGRMMRVSAENIKEVHEDAKRTVLPTAGPEVMVQPGRPTPLPGPRGGLRPNIPRNNRGNRGGLGVSHEVAKEHADRALGHLDTMAASEHGSGPYRQAQKSFHVVHGAIGAQNMSKSIHTMLQLAHNHIDTQQKDIPGMLTATKEAVGATLRAGKLAEEERTFRQIQTDRGGD